MMSSDKMEAVKISITLSNQVMTATLAMITAEGAFMAFVLGNREAPKIFYFFAMLAFVLFVASIFIGGKGITKTRDSGFAGDWNLTVGKPYFNYQAAICLLGLLMLFFMIACSGNTKGRDYNKDLSDVQKELQEIRKDLHELTIRTQENESNLRSALKQNAKVSP